MKKNIGRILLSIFGLIVVLAVLGGIKGAQIGAMISAGESFVMPPEVVTTAKVIPDAWEVGPAAVGSVIPVHAVTVSVELPGTITYLGFDSGHSVTKGQTLLKLDTSIEEAQLISAKAEATLMQSVLARTTSLRDSKVNTQADLDAAEARAQQAAAAVKTLEATIAKKTIHAPFSGTVGIRQVEIGQVLAPGTPIVSLQSLDPVYVEFSLPQQNLGTVARDQVIRLTNDVYPGQVWEGKIALVSPQIDSATRNVTLRALVKNPDGRLRSGMFASIQVVLEEKQPVLIVPATAVIYAPYGDSIFVVEEKTEGQKTARQQFVRLGLRRGDFVAVESGLTEGQEIVSMGAFKLRNGAAITVDNSQAPAVSTTPKPSDS